MEDMKMYDTVRISLSSGREAEFAIMDEFEFEEKHYIAVSLVVKEEIQEGMYLYRAEPDGSELEISRIEDPEEFEKVSAFFETR